MSRSFDSRSLTTRSSIMIWPPLMSSSPASMRSRVDLPQPEGPTSTTNSPSAMSRLRSSMIWTLPKGLRMLRKDTVAMGCPSIDSALDGAGREAADHVALEGVVDRRRRQGIDQARGHQQLPWRIVGRQEVAQRHGQCHALVVGQQQEGIEVLLPCQQQRMGATATSDGTISGRYTRRNSCSGDAPSMRAASSSSYGSLSEACLSTQMQYGEAIVTIANISAHRLPSSP